MKKLLSVLLLVLIAFSASACGSGGSKQQEDKKVSVVATIFPYYDFAKNIGGDKVNAELLIPAGSDIHSFEPTAQDIKKIQDCDLFIYNGGESDTWVDTILQSLDKENMPQIMKMTTYVTGIREQDDQHNFGDEDDEHIWLSLNNASNICGHIQSMLQSIDSSDTQTFKDNFTKYTNEISSVRQSIETVVKSSPKDRIIVGDRFPLIYFVDEFNIRWDCAFPGCSTETEPSLEKMTSLESKIKDNKYKAIIKLANSGNKVADTLAEDTGVKVVTFYDCENVSKKDIDFGETYTTLMAKNATAIKEALS